MRRETAPRPWLCQALVRGECGKRNGRTDQSHLCGDHSRNHHGSPVGHADQRRHDRHRHQQRGVSGTNAGDFAIASNTCGASLAGSASCTVSITFKPTATGSRTATLTFTDAAGNSPQTVALSGTGSAANATVAPTSLIFAATTIGTTTAAQSVTLTNDGTTNISLGFALSGTNAGDFAISGNTCGPILAGSATCTVSITFTPTGDRHANRHAGF